MADPLITLDAYVADFASQLEHFHSWAQMTHVETQARSEAAWNGLWDRFLGTEYPEVKSSDPIESSRASSADSIDHKPLEFGKFKGLTPDQVAATKGKVGENWLVWAYENVEKFYVCSWVLYKECGGTRKDPAAQPTPRDLAATGAKGFDDYDDDIPF